MDTQIKEMIESYTNTMKAYEAAAGTPEWEKAQKVIAAFEAAGQGADYMTFITRASEKDLFNQMTKALTELAGVISSSYKVNADTYKPPSVKDAAYGYHAAFDALPDVPANRRAREVYQRIFSIEAESTTAAEFMKKLAEENLFVKLSSGPIADHLRISWEDLQKKIETEKTGGVSLPVAEKYFREMPAKVEKAVTVSGVEALAYEEASKMQSDNLWDMYLLSETISLFLGPVISYRFVSSEENRQRVVNSFRHLAEFWNLTWDEAFRTERFIHYFENIFWKSVQNDYKGSDIKNAADLAADMRKSAVQAFKGEPFPVPAGPVRDALKQKVTVPLKDAYRVLLA